MKINIVDNLSSNHKNVLCIIKVKYMKMCIYERFLAVYYVQFNNCKSTLKKYSECQKLFKSVCLLIFSFIIFYQRSFLIKRTKKTKHTSHVIRFFVNIQWDHYFGSPTNSDHITFNLIFIAFNRFLNIKNVYYWLHQFTLFFLQLVTFRIIKDFIS